MLNTDKFIMRNSFRQTLHMESFNLVLDTKEDDCLILHISAPDNKPAQQVSVDIAKPGEIVITLDYRDPQDKPAPEWERDERDEREDDL